MSKSRFLSPLLTVSLLGFSLFLNGCSYLPWVGDEKEEDLSFESDVPADEGGKEDDFFAEEGKGKGKGKGSSDEGFASVDQGTDTHEMKSDVENLQQKQEALISKVRELEEMLRSLQPKVDATQQRLENSLGAVSEKSEYLEPEVKELKTQIARLHDELNELKSRKPKAAAGKARSPGKQTGKVPAEYTKAYEAYLSGKYDESIVMFQNFAVKNPPENLQDNIAYWIGANYAKLEMYDDAIKQFEAVLNKYPGGNKVHDSRFMLGYCYAKKGDKAHARDVLESALKTRPPKEVRQKIEMQLKEIQ
ncbi:MAG: tetratricopeptide repeat protein [Nitrospinae bacterium]|nr:tetratricopeptide repeat protein [Nitrospinota bacterium]